MALLQISEPGQAPDPHQRRIAVGIDLGTTHSLVASVRNGVAECLPDDKGQIILPSVVRYLPGQGRQIGHEAVANAALDPENTLASVKRFMGAVCLTLRIQKNCLTSLSNQKANRIFLKKACCPFKPFRVLNHLLK